MTRKRVTRQPATICESKPVTTPYIPTADLEKLARELFDGALPALPRDGVKRRSVLAREFAAAHLLVPGVVMPDAKKRAALAPAFRAIADSRQARVDAFLKTITPKPTVGSVRDLLVRELGEQALQVRVLNARHSIAAALVLLDRLEGKTDSRLDLCHADPQKFVARLDAAMPGARQHFYPGGDVNHSLRGLYLLAELADAVAESKAVVGIVASAGLHSPKAKPAPISAESLAAAIRAERDAGTRARLYQQFTALSDKH